jgi:hypothetical protein
MATVVATALACLAATVHAQDQGQKGQRGQGQGGQPGQRGGGFGGGGFGGGGFGGFGGGFGGFGGGFGAGTSRLRLLQVEAVQKELELVDEQLTAIQKVRDELQPMRGRGGPGGAPGGDAGGGRRRGGGNNPPPPNGASLRSADLYFVQAQQPPAQGGQGQGGHGRRGGGQGGGGFGGGGFQLTDEQRAEFEKQRLERLKQEKDKLAEILLPHQMKRLNEIYFQQLGTNIFEDPDAAAALKITDDQKKKATEVRTANREAMLALRQSFAPAGGNNDGGGRGRGNFTPPTPEQQAKIDELTKKNDASLMAILTADQTKQLEELKGKPFTMPENAFGNRGRGGPGGAPGGNRRGGNNP